MQLNISYVFFVLLLFEILNFLKLVSYQMLNNKYLPNNNNRQKIKLQDYKIATREFKHIEAVNRSVERLVNLKSLKKIDKESQGRIFCFILTTPSSIGIKGRAVYKSWAHKCDMVKFVFKFPNDVVQDSPLLNLVDFNYKQNGTIDLNHLLEPDQLPEESGDHHKISLKVFRTLAYIYKAYKNYNWYLKADDDTFIFMDNLRKFLVDKNSSEAITYGYNFIKAVPRGYHSGGAGYVLSHEAMRKLGQRLVYPNNNTCKMSGIEDKDVALCLRNMSIEMGNSTDELGRERFHPLNIRTHIFGTYPKWMHARSQNAPKSVCTFLVVK